MTFEPLESKFLSGPLVYRISVSGTLLYVGLSAKGLSRAFSGPHKCARFLQEPEACLELAFCSSLEEATLLEAREIHAKHPPLNRTCPECGRLRQFALLEGLKKTEQSVKRRALPKKPTDRLIAAILLEDLERRASAGGTPCES